MSFSWRSICLSLCLVTRLPTGVRKFLPRLVVAVRSLTSASRISWSSARSRCPSDLASVGRRSSMAEAMMASIRASTASVLARRPMERAKDRTWKGLIAYRGSPAFRRVSSKSRWKAPVGSYAIRSIPEPIQAISFRKPARSLGNRDALPSGAAKASSQSLEMSIPTARRMPLMSSSLLLCLSCEPRCSCIHSGHREGRWRSHYPRPLYGLPAHRSDHRPC